VTAALLYQAIGKQLSCILVDNGMLRKDEKVAVIAEFTKHFKTDLHVVHAEDRFLHELRGVAIRRRSGVVSGTASLTALRPKRSRSMMPGSWLKARCIRTSLKAGRRLTARPPRSNCTTTSADSQPNSASS